MKLSGILAVVGLFVAFSASADARCKVTSFDESPACQRCATAIEMVVDDPKNPDKGCSTMTNADECKAKAKDFPGCTGCDVSKIEVNCSY